MEQNKVFIEEFKGKDNINSKKKYKIKLFDNKKLDKAKY